ncbi:type III restriction-modification system endonuclease [Francisella philomiragia]|uniref:type III restriction-modification system endonuclease n=1 Tax=Francisella philomiragia TaxID=28110 RepID=UPI0019080CBA|nr:type III restriction-modification system endonuclease [Francisella philomiragia]
MAGFNFERDLDHQTNAVKSVLATFSGASITQQDKTIASQTNPHIQLGGSLLLGNLDKVQTQNAIDTSLRNKNSNIFDISMETGTGKTYTYTKMMFELHENFGIGKFVIIVPTLSIKAGTLSFLRAKATKEHFRQDYKCEIKTHVVESKSNNKTKSSFPQAVREFVEAGHNSKNIHVLVINSGMINSDTMTNQYDIDLLDKYSSPFDAIAATQPFTIIDEPHKFATANKTWANIEKLKSQYIIRYGATFDDKYENLIYKLTAVDAFNQDLVKGVVTHIEDFNQKEHALVKVVELPSKESKEVKFELDLNGKKSTYKLIKGASLSKIHHAMHDLTIENANTQKVVLSNGLELKKGDKISPYSYSQDLQSRMIENAIKRHFAIEKKYLTRDIRIKPLTLFFIDDISGYRGNESGEATLRIQFESIAIQYIKQALENETNEFYKEYLQKSLDDISQIHGGYFSKDNTGKDDKVDKEVNEILHDKEALLSLDNTRRFIFSKWTLKEGWDNPNVFQICKIRSSGSDTSKLQEVGRGLRIPVNEFMARAKEEQHDLHYYVDFTERLVNEINTKSQSLFVDNPVKLTAEMISEIVKLYYTTEDDLLERLDDENVIKRNNDFKEGGYAKLKQLYPRIISESLKSGKVKKASDKNVTATIRKGKYDELKDLWETINQKVILEYKIDSEENFKNLLRQYFQENYNLFKPQEIATKERKIVFDDNFASVQENIKLDTDSLQISTIKYKTFLSQLAVELSVNIKTLHSVFDEIKDNGLMDIRQFMNNQTIRTIKAGFGKYLLDNAIDKYEIGYNNVSNTVHPTKFTNSAGDCLDKIQAMDLGVTPSSDKPSDKYFFEEMFYDSELEKQNILENIDEVIVFTKIPKNSIKIPVAGGYTYSPDFAYIVKDKQGQKSLSLIVETKNKAKRA